VCNLYIEEVFAQCAQKVNADVCYSSYWKSYQK